jgi:hypothetical protein
MSVRKDFRTCDLYFAAFLKATGIPFLKSAKVGRKTYFVFENPENMRELRDGYFSGTANVSALRHANEIRNLKRLCHL